MTVQMVSRRKVAVSGTPTADVEVSIPDAVPVAAEEVVPYRAWDGSRVAEVEGGCRDYVLLEDQTTWEDGAWYVAEGVVSINDAVRVQGTANLILCDGASVTANKGIRIDKGALNVYGQSGGTGKLTSTGKGVDPGIGGNGCAVAIHGGEVIATSSASAGVGGSALSNENGSVTVYGGKVTATGGGASAGIGNSLFNTGNCSVAIHGGEVTATGGMVTFTYGAAGIGGSAFGQVGSITLSGGVVTAYGNGASAIGAGSNGTGGDVRFDGAAVRMYPGTDENGQFLPAVRASNVSFGGEAAQEVLFRAKEGDELSTAAETDRVSVLTSSGRQYVEVRPAQAHVHQFSFTAAGATITAACTDDCPLPGHAATATISAPELTSFGQEGASAEAIVDDPAGILGGAKVEYQTRREAGDTVSYGEPSDQAPTGAGDHRASVTVGGATAHVDYRVAKAAPVAAIPEGVAATYGERLSDVGLANPEGNTDGLWAWDDPAQVAGDAGERSFKATFTPADARNYESAAGIDVPVAVGKAESPAVAGGRVAVGVGQSVDLASCVVRCGARGEASFRIAGDARGCSLEGSTLKAGNQTGRVRVEATVAGDANFLASSPMDIQVEVTGKASQQLTFASSLVQATYGDASVVNPLSGAQTAVSYSSSDESVARVSNKGEVTVAGAGRATIVAAAEGTDEVAAAAAFYVLEVAKAPCVVTVPVAAEGLVANSETRALVTPGSAEGGRLQYALGAESGPSETYSDGVPAASEVGTYHVWYRAAGDSNHLDSAPACVVSAIYAPTFGPGDEPTPTPVEPAPGPVDPVPGPGPVDPAPVTSLGLAGLGHVQSLGDVAAATSGAGILIGTTGQSRRLEAVSLALTAGVEGSVEYRSHLQGTGWEPKWAADGALSGTVGEARRVEAVQMRLSGTAAETHSVWYRVHSQTYGWLGWARDGQAAGTAGQAKRAEAVEVCVLPKGQLPEGYAEGQASYVGAVSGTAHLQGVGWTAWGDSLLFGTTGEARRLEAFRLALADQPLAGGIEYAAHVQGVGWQPSASDGAVAGTEGESRRVEAVKARLTGDMAAEYSVWYRVHSQTFGWLGWARDGEEAGTTGLAKRAEAVEVQVLPAGQVPAGYDPSVAACVVGL